MKALWLVALVAGCGWSETRFQVDGLTELCRQAAACEGTFSAETCLDVLRAEDRSGCDYDPVAARDCGKGEGECQESPELGVSTFVFPEACALVYDCDPPVELPPR